MKKIFTITLLSCFFTAACVGQDDKTPLSKDQANYCADTLFQSALSSFTSQLDEMWENRVLEDGEYQMPFWYEINGNKPANGYPMYISMHGGGGAPAEVNDQQWENQKRLYGTVPGIYWVPRAPTDTWNMWHQEYMEGFLQVAISYAVDKLGADPNRIYLLGYSAGGDGTFNLAPRNADKFAAAAMMAGHPGDAVAENLRNLPFAIYMGGLDDAFNRNGLAVEWGEKLAKLHKDDPQGYENRVVIYPEKGHWMDNEDKEAIAWLASHTRNPYPQKIIWVQDDVLDACKYNLLVRSAAQGDALVVSYDKATNSANIEYSDYKELTIFLNDQILDLDKPVNVTYQGKSLFSGKVDRTLENLKFCLNLYSDRAYIFPSKVDVSIP